MVSRRIYFTIAVIIFIIFFLFLFSVVTLEIWNDYDKNSYVKDVNQLPGKNDAYQGATQSQESAERMAVYIGDTEGTIGNMVKAWALYSKRVLKTYASIAEFGESKDIETQGADRPKMIIIDPSGVNWDDSSAAQSLEKRVKSGMNLVFCSLPDADTIEKNPSLRRLLGIRKITAKSTTVAGTHLYGGFLLGGEMIYRTEDAKENRKKQDMDLTCPWYHLASGTRVYMKGVPKDKSIQSKDFPPIIWEKSFETASVFAVNGTYMEDVTGLGLLSAMEAKTKAYTIYPVVNAQNLIVANYPGMAAENSKEMMRRYSQSMKHVMRDIIWPTIIAAQYRNPLGLSCMMTPQFDYADKNKPDQDLFIYFMKLLNEQGAEAGISAITVSHTPIEQKLREDQAFIQRALPDYPFTSLYAGKLDQATVEDALKQDILKDARTVVKNYDGDSEILGYATDTVTEQQTVADGLKYTYRQDFRTKSLETALGYSSVLIDVTRAAYPQDNSDDTWEDIARDMGWDLEYYWKNFKAFSGTNVSDCDERIRNFLMLDYKDWQEGSTIHLKISDYQGSVWFILRAHNKKIKEIQGGDWEEIESDAFLIKARQEHVTITLKPADGFQYIYR
ncbi:MAG: DUF2194 domain-containing protein [Firmicutes bacterium]|nr:DUF2194 domain-containing protein [Bacillota bacterium]